MPWTEETEDRVRLPGGETVPRRIERKGETTLRPPDRPPVDIDGWEVLDDDGDVVELSITLRTQPGEPGLSMRELGEINPAALHHNWVLFEVWKTRAALRTSDFDVMAATGRTVDDLGRERGEQARKALQATSKRLRSKSTITPDRLAEIVEAFDRGGINAVEKLGYSRSYGYKLLRQARNEVIA